MKKCLSSLLVFIAFSAFGQGGCTDPNAQNFNPNAQWNDGSCLYDSLFIAPSEITLLSTVLNENSGLFFRNDTIWTHNDSGNSSTLFALDTFGTLLRQVVVANATNADWEAITFAGNYGYVGDFGNNVGTRTNLKLYRFAISDLQNDTISVDSISFVYANQTSFTSNAQTNFDAEAFIVINDTVHVFTKNWGNQFTNHFIFPAQIGLQSAQLIDSFFVDGLITDAAFDSVNGTIVLLGYRSIMSSLYESFLWVLFDNQHGVFSGNKRKISIGNMFAVGQTEGLTFKNAQELYLSSEQIQSGFIVIPPRLFQLNISQIFSQTANIPQNLIKISVYPNPATNEIHVEQLQKPLSFQLKNAAGQDVLSGEVTPDHPIISVDKKQRGVYFLTLENKEFVRVVLE